MNEKIKEKANKHFELQFEDEAIFTNIEYFIKKMKDRISKTTDKLNELEEENKILRNKNRTLCIDLINKYEKEKQEQQQINNKNKNRNRGKD